MQIQKIILAAALPMAMFASLPAEAQSGQSTRFSYHQSYHDHGYDRRAFRYNRRVCETRSSGGLGLGALLDAGPVVSVNVQLGGRFTECDHRQYAWASTWSAQSRNSAYWENPHSGARGVVRPRDYYDRGSRTCARFESESWSGYGEYDRGDFEMCRNHRGEWEFSGGYERRR
jgi:surface antigen